MHGRCKDVEFAGKCELCVNNHVDLIHVFCIMIHAGSLI